MAQDGVRGAINYDANDRFCLNGERLIGIAGVYGGNGAEYRTERESFAKIVSEYGAYTFLLWPHVFKVWTKSGELMEYEWPIASEQATAGWALSRITDRKGNYLTVSYIGDGKGQRPDRIDYTGNTSAGTTPNASVRFAYETRGDVSRNYLGRYEAVSTKRLVGIKTYVGETLVNEYRLTYAESPATHRSRLSSITQCDRAGSCFPPTLLGWSEASPAWAASNLAATLYQGSSVKFLAGDFNGDGQTDLAQVSSAGWQSIPTCLSTGTGWSCSNPSAPIKAGGTFLEGDFNGDGKGDIAEVHDSWGSILVCLSTGTAWQCSDWPATYVDGLGSGNGGSGIYTGAKFLAGDFNGDGRTDIIQVNDSWTSIPVCYSTGTAWECHNYFAPPAPGQGGSGIYATGEFLVGDFDGDGKADVAQVNYGWMFMPVCLSTGSGWQCRKDDAIYFGGEGFDDQHTKEVRHHARG